MTPNRPFADVGLDLFEFQTSHYLVLLDYYSKFIEVDQLPRHVFGISHTRHQDSSVGTAFPRSEGVTMGLNFAHESSALTTDSSTT
jgi:hypothetical protein